MPNYSLIILHRPKIHTPNEVGKYVEKEITKNELTIIF